jgi:hypothetical protein
MVSGEATPVNNQQEIQGRSVSGRIWKKPRKRFSANYIGSLGLKSSLEKRMEKKKKEQETKDLSKQINNAIKAERDEQIKRIKQKKQAKLENQIKAQMHKPLSQRKKSTGQNQRLTVKDYKRVKASRDFAIAPNEI